MGTMLISHYTAASAGAKNPFGSLGDEKFDTRFTWRSAAGFKIMPDKIWLDFIDNFFRSVKEWEENKELYQSLHMQLQQLLKMVTDGVRYINRK